MADGNNADSHHPLSVDTLHQVPKDMQGPDNSVPLSPQWLLPKPGDMKHGMVAAGESRLSPYPGYASRSGISKLSRNGEDAHETEKKRDVFRPSLHDLDSGRRDRWRDEERDTNSAIRRDRWKDGEKEIGDTRKMDRWVETSIRHSGEPRRAPSDRWNDQNNRDGNYDQRRDNKWNTRWGPDDKESESWREKSYDSGRDSELPRDKVLSQVSNHGKEDKEVDHYRPWRSNSSQSRGRGEPPHHQNLTQSRQTPMLNIGRGRGESSPPNFTVGRGRVGSGGSVFNNISSHPHSVGVLLDKGDSSYHDHSTLKYSRIKLLDIYRTTDVRSHKSPLDGFSELPPSLTQDEPLDPLALSAPTPEELGILKGIDKGDIVSSGMPQASKEGSVGRSSTDLVQLGRTKIGSREDSPSATDDYKQEPADNSNSAHLNYSDNPFEKYVHPYGSDLKSEAIHDLQTRNNFSIEALRSDTASHNRANDASISREVSIAGSSAYPSAPWRSESLAERTHSSSHDWRELPPQLRSRTSDIGWSHLQNRDTTFENSSTVAQSYYKDQPNWQAREGIPSDYGRESIIKRQLSGVLDREQESRKLLHQTSPEDLSLYYKDPQGEIQGPFSGSDLIGWFEAGYFGIDLQVRVANALSGTPFSSLGDVMPHLRAKAKAPPGFGAPKPNEISETINRPSFNNLGKLHTNSSEIDIKKTEPRNRNESVNEAENRFLESLMSGSLSSSPLEKFVSSEGLQGYIGNNPVGMPPMGLESGNDLNYLLAQRLSLERQRSLPNPHSSWPGRDAASALPKAELAPESLIPHSKLLHSMADSPHQVPLSQNVDFISLLQGVNNKSASSALSSGVSSWSNFPVQGGLDMRQDKMDMHHNQLSPQASYGVQQQRSQTQNQPAVTNIGQSLDNSSGIVTPEKLLSSGLSQDPRMLNLLQQQYLASQLQLHSQTPAPPQLSLLDKFLLLKQQEEQKQQLLLKQHILSQVLSERQSHQHLSEPYGHLQGAASPAVNGPVDHLGLRAPYEAYQGNSQSSLSNFQGGVFPSQVSQDVGHRANSEASSLQSSHQMFESTYQKVEDATRKEQSDETQLKESLLVSATAGSRLLPDATRNTLHEASVLQKHGIVPENCVVIEEQTLQNARTNDAFETSIRFTPSKRPGIPEPVLTSRTDTNEISIPEQSNDVTHLEELEVQKEQIHCESPSVKGKGGESLEVKKVSEKKSRKQKNSKANSSSDKAKGVPQPKQSEIEGKISKDSKSSVRADAGETLYGTLPVETEDTKSGIYTLQNVGSQQVQSLADNIIEPVERKVHDQPNDEVMSPQNQQIQSGHRGWKPATGVKAKSLLEIQEEEERVAQKQMALSDTATSVNLATSSLPWTGVVANAEPKTLRGNHQEATSDSVSNPRSKKSQLHDLLAEEVLAKSDVRVLENPDNVSCLPSVPVIPKQTGSAVDNDDFIQAKDSKKSRKKKSGKVKGAGVKASTPVASADASVVSSPIEKVKSNRQVQQEKEILPAPPSGPSLGDFVLWKGEYTNSSPAPAWSTDSGKLSKPTSLRDIQKEQGKRAPVSHQAPIPTPQKAQPTRGIRGNGTSGSSPSNSASTTQTHSIASTQSKSKVEDDLFWGPLDQSKQEAKRSGFPSLANPSSVGYKNTPVKGTLGGSSSRQKFTGSRPADYSLSSSPATAQSSLKGRRDAITKHSEAMDFRDWCESETVRLTGSTDTSFLEFCLKQSTSEAEILLIENLGSFDPDHEFIDKFLNYKELLSADVLEIAFQARIDSKAAGFGVRDGKAIDSYIGELDPDMAVGPNESTKGGGKKKAKKGKKVSPSVLGFNVVSNRIMMGEIQTVEE